VTVPDVHVCCGRPLYDFGLLDSATKYLERVLSVLKQPLVDGLPIVVLEPSCFAVFRDEAADLLPNHPDVRDGRLRTPGRTAVVHGHCHQKALTGMDHSAAVLAALGVEATMLDAGCCGMAGAFGFEADHYEVSMRIGERVLLPAMRQASADTLLVADGFSCREQIGQATGRYPLHLAQVVRLALQRR
jgi:Fe-S oxidoreductase